jgi:hypothetical protein
VPRARAADKFYNLIPVGGLAEGLQEQFSNRMSGSPDVPVSGVIISTAQSSQTDCRKQFDCLKADSLLPINKSESKRNLNGDRACGNFPLLSLLSGSIFNLLISRSVTQFKRKQFLWRVFARFM